MLRTINVQEPPIVAGNTRKRSWPYELRLKSLLASSPARDCMATSLKVNGHTHSVDVDASTPLLYVLADELGLNGPKFGCGMAQCGACTVLVRGHAVRSCVMPLSAVGQDDITTLEELGTPGKPHPIQQAFIDQDAAQCGFCLSGVILTAKAFLDRNPKATTKEIRDAMSGVLCRCFAQVRMFRAIEAYAREKSA
jgi:nicotinate dehydrogenase subunit A